jgi:hypothetical protein
MLQRKYQTTCGRTDKRGAAMPNLRFARRQTLNDNLPSLDA